MAELAGTEVVQGVVALLVFLVLFAAAKFRFTERGPAHGPGDNGLD